MTTATSFTYVYDYKKYSHDTLEGAVRASMQATLRETPEADQFDLDMANNTVTFTLKNGDTMILNIVRKSHQTRILLGSRSIWEIKHVNY